MRNESASIIFAIESNLDDNTANTMASADGRRDREQVNHGGAPCAAL